MSEPTEAPVIATVVDMGEREMVERADTMNHHSSRTDVLEVQQSSNKQDRYDCLNERADFVKSFQRASNLNEKIQPFNTFLAHHEIILDVLAKKPSKLKITDSLRKWISDVAAPIYNCLHQHCDGLDSEFAGTENSLPLRSSKACAVDHQPSNAEPVRSQRHNSII
jgi:hypothetical protein